MPDRKIPQHGERALLAEAMMWDYERDFMPDDMEIVERDDLLVWKRAGRECRLPLFVGRARPCT